MVVSPSREDWEQERGDPLQAVRPFRICKLSCLTLFHGTFLSGMRMLKKVHPLVPVLVLSAVIAFVRTPDAAEMFVLGGVLGAFWTAAWMQGRAEKP